VLIQQHHYQAVPASEEKLTSGTFGVNLNNTAVDSSRWVYQTQLFKINLVINNISILVHFQQYWNKLEC
jgi:hypothetical protein